MVTKLRLVPVEETFCDACQEEHPADFTSVEVEVAGTKAELDLCTTSKAAYDDLVRAVTGIIIGADGQPVGESTPQVVVEPADSAPAATVTTFPAERRARVIAQDDPDAIMCTRCGARIRPGSKYVHAPKMHGVRASEIQWVRVADLIEDTPKPVTEPSPVIDLMEAIEAKQAAEKPAKKERKQRTIKDDLSTVRCPVRNCGVEILFPEKNAHAFTVHRVTSTNLEWTWVRKPDVVHVCAKCTGEFPTAASLERHVRYYESRPKETHKNGGVTAVNEYQKYDGRGNLLPTPAQVNVAPKRADVVAAQGSLPAFNSKRSPF